MNYTELISDIKNDTIKSLYFFTGDEEYLMHETIEILKNKYIDKSFEALNFMTIDSKEASFDSILNASETLPFMSSKKIVIIRDISEIVENTDKDFAHTMSSYMEKLGDYICMIIMDRFNKLRKTNKIYKTARKLDGVVEFPKLRGRDLNLWLERKLKKYNKNISRADLNYFIQQSTYGDYNSLKTLYDLENELLKVVNHTLEDNITKNDIDLVLVRSLDTNIFNLLTSIAKKDSESALRIFNEMYISNEPIQRILFMIIRQVRLMLGYKLYKEKGYSDSEAQRKLQIKLYEFKKISLQSNNFTELQLRRAMDNILETDIKQKTSSHDEKLALEMVIINLSHII